MVVYLDGLCIQVKMFSQKVEQFFTYIYFGAIKLLFVHPERKFRINACNDIITDNALLKIIKFLVPVYELHDIYVMDYILKKKVMKTIIPQLYSKSLLCLHWGRDRGCHIFVVVAFL